VSTIACFTSMPRSPFSTGVLRQRESRGSPASQPSRWPDLSGDERRHADPFALVLLQPATSSASSWKRTIALPLGRRPRHQFALRLGRWWLQSENGDVEESQKPAV